MGALRMAWILGWLVACSSATTSTDGGVDAAMDSVVAGATIDTTALFIDGCQAFSSICSRPGATVDCGKCQYRIMYRSYVCTTAHPCDDLLLYWSALGCEQDILGAFLARLVGAYPDLVAACVQPHYPGEPLPSTIGAPQRENTVVGAVFNRLRAGGDLGVWTGARVLHGGCSIGATRLPVASARFVDDRNWLGTTKTAACISDGVVDVVHQLDYVTNGTGMSCVARMNRVARSYGVPYPADCGGGDCMAFESIMMAAPPPATFVFSPGVTVADFAIRDWKLVTEGGAFSDPTVRCERDVVSGAPFEALCAALDADPNHTCTLQTFPSRPHCGAYPADFETTCLSWFRAL